MHVPKLSHGGLHRGGMLPLIGQPNEISNHAMLGPQRYGSVQRLTSLPWHRPPRQASNWVEALLFAAIRRTRLTVHLAKVLRESILQRVMSESKTDYHSTMYPGASVGPRILLGGGATSADDPALPHGLPSSVPHWIEGEPAMPMADFLQGLVFPPPSNLEEDLPRRPRARARFDLGDLHVRLQEVQASRMPEIPLLGDNQSMVTRAGRATRAAGLALPKVPALAEPEIGPAPWDFRLIKRGPEAPVEDVVMLGKAFPQLSRPVMVSPSKVGYLVGFILGLGFIFHNPSAQHSTVGVGHAVLTDDFPTLCGPGHAQQQPQVSPQSCIMLGSIIA
jgi:hypothetical protein